MGDRANIAIITEHNKAGVKPEQIWLYSHWGGTDLWKALQEGLQAAKPRWTDPSYCTRIIICHAIPQKQMREETGYGISTTLQDNEHPILVVDIPNQEISIIQEDDLTDGQIHGMEGFSKIATFEKYLTLKKDPRHEK